MTYQSEHLLMVASDRYWRQVQTLERQLWERDQEVARLREKLDSWSLALQSLTPGGSEFRSSETCEAYVRERLEHGHEQTKEVVRLKREVTDLRDRFRHTHEQAEVLSDTTCRKCGLDLRDLIHRHEESGS